MNLIKSILLCIFSTSSTLFSQSITSSCFFSGGAVSSNESYSCSSILGETFVGSGSNEQYYLSCGSQFVKVNTITGVHRTENSSLPDRYSLSQNYPNSFNPSTTIRYDLPRAANVTLRIFNALGQVVAVLVNREMEAGYHQVHWSATLPSGVYFYRLQAGEYVETRKMMFLK